MTHPNRQFRGERASTLFAPLAYDPGARLFLLDDESLGFGFVCQPLSGSDDAAADRLTVLLNQDWPPGTLLQMALWATPDIDENLARMLGLRLNDPGEVLRQSTQERVRFLREGVDHSLIAGTDLRVRDLLLVVTVKLPLAAGRPTEAEHKQACELRDASEQVLATAGLQPRTLDADALVRIMGTLLNWSQEASWRQRLIPECDPHQLVKEQFLDYTHALEVDSTGLTLGDARVQTLSVKRYPDRIGFGLAGRYLGDPFSGTRGISDNVLLTMNVHFPEQEGVRTKMRTQRQWAANVAYGPIAKFIPEIAVRKHGYDVLFNALDNGNRPVQVYMGVVLFSPATRAQRSLSNALTYWRELGFQLMRDSFFALPLFLHCLPFGAERKAIRETMRYRTMAADQATALAPVFGDWKGTGTPVVNLISRRGQLMDLSLFDSQTNFNTVIAASSGSGKSFLTNELIASYLSTGARCWVIDVGRSYEKLCDALGGQFVAFTPEANLCINPFDAIRSWEEEADVLVAIVSAMAAPTEPLGDFRTAALKRVMKAVWDDHGTAMTVDTIAEALLADPDERVRDVGKQLFSCTSAGEYGRFFNGRNNVRFDDRLVVLELEELKGRKHLQQLVLLILIYQIQQAMYLGDRSILKLLLIDEAWDLLTQGDIAKFIETGYRRFRKYGGAAVTITQSLTDLYINSVGRAIVENSANTLLLAQPGQIVDQLASENRLPLPAHGAELLKTVHTVPGAYSEILAITTVGAGIGRLIVDPFRQLLYSTSAKDVAALDRLRQRGLGISEAIHTLLEERRRGA